jgi:iron complex transport system ATP-binding protein
MTLYARNLVFRYGRREVLREIDLTLEPGLTALVGPNAAGKSTLLKCLCGVLRAAEGFVTLDGRPVQEYPRQELAQRIGYLPQSDFRRGGLTVFETVLLGRLHDLSWRVSSSEIQRVETLLAELSLDSLSGRAIGELSGGQAQLVAIAQVLIRDPAVLLLDEPTSNLDLRRQFEICSRIRDLTDTLGISTLISIHDLHLAARYADRIIVLHQGRIHSSGTPAKILTNEMMADVYQLETEVSLDMLGFPSLRIHGPWLGEPKS